LESSGNNYSQIQILIVDDTQANVTLLKHVLPGEGYGIITANSGAEALSKAKDHIPDLILLDIMMPEMNGYEVCKKLKDIDTTSEIPVIFLSALTDTYDKVKGFKVGGVDYITKPFKREEILARIGLHIRLKQYQQEKEERIKVLRDRELELSKLNREKDELMRIVSHDIKNPLTGIIGVVNILKEEEDVDESERKHMLNMIEQSGNELLDLVTEILDKNMVRREDQMLETEQTDLITILKEVISINAPNAKLKRIDIYLKTDLKECILDLDIRKIKQVFNNLVSNALKFTPSKGEVSLQIIEKENCVECRVADTGIGIPEDIVDKLFEDQDLESTLGTSGEVGTGLGLDLVHNFVDRHGGRVWVESEANKGTTFFIQIPTSMEE